jgi:hypothetical protein
MTTCSQRTGWPSICSREEDPSVGHVLPDYRDRQYLAAQRLFGRPGYHLEIRAALVPIAGSLACWLRPRFTRDGLPQENEAAAGVV